ncbi:hypothetical protein TKK_0006985 [Trichogramma kaykai]
MRTVKGLKFVSFGSNETPEANNQPEQKDASCQCSKSNNDKKAKGKKGCGANSGPCAANQSIKGRLRDLLNSKDDANDEEEENSDNPEEKALYYKYSPQVVNTKRRLPRLFKTFAHQSLEQNGKTEDRKGRKNQEDADAVEVRLDTCKVCVNQTKKLTMRSTTTQQAREMLFNALQIDFVSLGKLTMNRAIQD